MNNLLIVKVGTFGVFTENIIEESDRIVRLS